MGVRLIDLEDIDLADKQYYSQLSESNSSVLFEVHALHYRLVDPSGSPSISYSCTLLYVRDL